MPSPGRRDPDWAARWSTYNRPITGTEGSEQDAPDPIPTTPLAGPNGTVRVPDGGTAVNQLGIVSWDGDPPVRLRAGATTDLDPTTGTDNIIGALAFNTRVQVMQSFAGDWLLVSTSDGRLGFVARPYVWFGAEHPMPEPNARLHLVEGGAAGFALAIAARYYSDVSEWGADLRYYVNVLGAVNPAALGGATDDWHQVNFKAGEYIWIPSNAYARSLHGSLSSGSLSYEVADAVGLAEPFVRVKHLVGDFGSAIGRAGDYLPAALAAHVTDSLVQVLQSLLLSAIGAVALLAVTTAIGAAIGALAGGVGAVPGAVAGLEVGQALLEWIGGALFAGWIAGALAQIGGAFGAFLGTVWNANGDAAAVDLGAHQFADAVGVLAGALLEALAFWAAGVGAKQAVARLADTPLGRAFGPSQLESFLENPPVDPKLAEHVAINNRRLGIVEPTVEVNPALLEAGDPWTVVTNEHQLDSLVVEICERWNVSPALADRLLKAGVDQWLLGETVMDYELPGAEMFMALLDAGVPRDPANNAMQIVEKNGPLLHDPVIALVRSGNLQNAEGFPKFLEEVDAELKIKELGKLTQILEARDRAIDPDNPSKVGIEGRKFDATDEGDPPTGQADVLDYTRKEAIQIKYVTSKSWGGVVDENLYKAIEQLTGKRGETPPTGFRWIAEIIIANPDNEMYALPGDRLLKEQLVGWLSETYLTKMEPPISGDLPGIIRFKNLFGTFDWLAKDFRGKQWGEPDPDGN